MIDNTIYISHDHPIDSNSLLSLTNFLDSLKSSPSSDQILFANIKEDGLADHFLNFQRLILQAFKDVYYFDMSVPQHLLFSQKQMKCLARSSEYENASLMSSLTQGYWHDTFTNSLDVLFQDAVSHIESSGIKSSSVVV